MHQVEKHGAVIIKQGKP